MAGRIPDETLDAIRDRVSLVEIVSGYVALKKAGRNHVGLCPFHSEKTPSFTVSEERGLFHCFGCGAGGSVFAFVMRVEHCSFPEAVESLARRAGVSLPERSAPESQQQRQGFFRLNELAQRYLRRCLQSDQGQLARAYLQRRGLRAETIERYGLGYCPPSGSGFLQAIASRPRAVQAAAHLGLVGRRGDGVYYERFRNRVTFPIRDGGGRIVGFGGRTLGDDPPKYLNSPESVLFHKGRVLYGLFEAREAIREAGRVVLVEGYMDVLSLAEARVAPVVATLGTALTAEQLKLARRFAPEVVAFFDGDRAGQQAAERAFEICAEAGIWGLGAFLPQDSDPDSYVRTHGSEATQRLLEKAVPLANFFLDRVDPGPRASVPERVRAAERYALAIARVQNPMTFGLLARQGAQRLGVDESVLRAFGARAARAQPDRPAGHEDAAAESWRPEEISLLEAMVLDRAAAELVAASGILQRLESSALADAAAMVAQAWADGSGCEGVVDRLPPALAERVAGSLLGNGPAAGADHQQVARDCMRRIEQRLRRAEQRSAVQRLRQIEAHGDDRELRRELERSSQLLRQREVPHG